MVIIEENFNYSVWGKCIRLSNNIVELIIPKDIGPRIIKFGFINGLNLLKEFRDQAKLKNSNEWLIYGGHRLWHAPENVPRTYFPDNFPIKYKIEDNILKISQEIEKTTGIKKELEIELHPFESKVKIIHKLINKNLWTIKLAPWALTSMEKGGRMIVPQEIYEPPSRNYLPVRPLVLWSYTKMRDPRWIWGNKYIQLKQDSNAKTPQKIGVFNTHGWISYYLNGNVFIKNINCNDKENYTDLGCNMEIYTNSEMLELETLGSFTNIEPESCVLHIENWFIFRLCFTEEEESIDNNLLPLIDKIKCV